MTGMTFLSVRCQDGPRDFPCLPLPPCPGNLPSLAAMSIPGFIFRAGRVMPEQGLLHAPVPFSRKTACFRPASLGGSFTHGERGAYAKLAYCKRTARERRRGGNRVVNLINDFCHQMEQGAGHREGSVPDCVESYVVGERFLPWKISGAPWRETELPQIFIDVRDK